MIARIKNIFILAIVILLFNSIAYAFYAPGPKWKLYKAEYTFDKSVKTPYKSAIMRAAQTWNNAGSGFSFINVASVNAIKFANLDVDVPGRTDITYIVYPDSTKYITNAITTLNNNKIIKWWIDETPCPSDYIDLETVALHEYGHWLMLDHTADFFTVMYPQYLFERRVLSIDDADGINYIYTLFIVQITDAIASYLGPMEEPFFTKTFIFYGFRKTNIVLAGDYIGAGSWWVDDIIRINVTHIKDNITLSWEYSSLAQSQEPVDLSYLFDFDSGNSVYVELANDPNHINYVGSSALWLVGQDTTMYLSGKYLDNSKYSSTTDSVKQNTYSYRLIGCKPNPAQERAIISYELPAKENVILRIYNLNGQLVKTLVNGFMNAGIHTCHWDGMNENKKKVSQGVYFYRLQAGSYTDAKKLIWLK